MHQDILKLRQRAERLLSEKTLTVQDIEAADIPALIHELQTHQIELTLQNEELQAANSALEESRAHHVELYDHAPVGYFTFDDRGRILAVNLTGSRQLGLAKDVLFKQPFTAFLSQDDSDLFYLHLRKVFASQSRQSCTLTLSHEQGRTLHVQLDSIPSLHASQKNHLSRSTITDITERKELENALKASEILFRRLFEETREGIIIIDAETGRISDANPFLMEMLGHAHEDLLGKSLWEIGVHMDKDMRKSFLAALQKKGYVRYGNVPIETQHGRHITAECIGSTFMVNNHKIIQCHLRENSIQHAHSGAERRVQERRSDWRASIKQQQEQRQQHLQTEESLQEALAEIKSLRERLVSENTYFYKNTKKNHQFDPIIGQSKALKKALYKVEQVAPTDTTVLILGETGTGKELIAAAIHSLSSRRDRKMITVNCAALPANLIESELFGREKGAFTGADSRQKGRFEIADGSTLCLDEIGELAPELQAKLLRVIQHGEFERLGSSKTIRADVRILAMTNLDLEEAMQIGRFREDLFYRLNIFPITVPPLRKRKDDIPLLVQAFVEKFSMKLGKRITSIPKKTMALLQDYPWPGNIRQLENIIHRAVIISAGPVLQLEDKRIISPPSGPSPGTTMKEIERNQILKTLAETRWRIEGNGGAAMILDIHPSTLRAKMQKLGIVRPEIKITD